jgi:hypothetical protein
VSTKICILSCKHISFKINMFFIQTTRAPVTGPTAHPTGGAPHSLETSRIGQSACVPSVTVRDTLIVDINYDLAVMLQAGIIVICCIGAVSWLRSLVTGLSPRRPGFTPGSIHVGFVVDKVALGQVFLRVLRFFPVTLQTHIIWGMRNMLT